MFLLVVPFSSGSREWSVAVVAILAKEEVTTRCRKFLEAINEISRSNARHPQSAQKATWSSMVSANAKPAGGHDFR